MKMLSIVVPIFNKQKYIARFIDSVKNQSNSNFEIIFVDDGSLDQTLQVLRSELTMVNFDNKLICSQENNGVSSARNLGISESGGEYITFADVDDVLGRGFVEQRIKSMQQGTDLSINSVLRYYQNGRTKIEKFGGFEGLELIRTNAEAIIDLIFRGHIPAYSVQFTLKRDIAKKNMFNNKISFQEDVLYFINVLSTIKEVIVSDTKDYYYWQNYESVTHNLSMAHMIGLLEVTKMLELNQLPISFYVYKQKMLGIVLYHIAKLTYDGPMYSSCLKQLTEIRKLNGKVDLFIPYVFLGFGLFGH